MRLRVETFSIGFGTRIFGFRYGDTDYRISILPLGGYVKMAGELGGDGAPLPTSAKQTDDNRDRFDHLMDYFLCRERAPDNWPLLRRGFIDSAKWFRQKLER